MKRIGPLVLLALLSAAAGARAQSELQAMLDAHNAYRARYCAPPLAWSTELAAGAQQWANQCVFQHSHGGRYGENLAWGTRLSGPGAVALWYDEARYYNFASPGFGPAGHFSQLVWRGSQQIGCGGATCQGNVFWVCRYTPPGNYEGKYRENVAPMCR